MPKKFAELKAKMSPEARERVSRRVKTALSELAKAEGQQVKGKTSAQMRVRPVASAAVGSRSRSAT